jgi:hypothetical protein
MIHLPPKIILLKKEMMFSDILRDGRKMATKKLTFINLLWKRACTRCERVSECVVCYCVVGEKDNVGIYLGWIGKFVVGVKGKRITHTTLLVAHTHYGRRTPLPSEQHTRQR